MTRKSESRLRRDAVLKQAQEQNIQGGYDILNDMYAQQCGLFEQYGKMAALLGHEEISPFVVDMDRAQLLMRGLDHDAGELVGKVHDLYRGHAGKTGYGNPNDEDEYYNVMQMQQQYIVYMGVHQQNLLPIMFEMDEHLKAAIDNKQKLQAAAIAAAQVQQATEADVQVTETAPAVHANPYEQPAV